GYDLRASHLRSLVNRTGTQDLHAAVDDPRRNFGSGRNDLDRAAIDLKKLGKAAGYDKLGAAVQHLVEGDADDEIEAACVDRGSIGEGPRPHDLEAAVNPRATRFTEYDLGTSVDSGPESFGLTENKSGGRPFDNLDAAIDYGIGGGAAGDQLNAASVDQGGNRQAASKEELKAAGV